MKKLFFFATPVVITMAIIGCAKEGTNPQLPTASVTETTSTSENGAKFSTSVSKFTDEELFLGIFFLKGAVADEVEALVNLKTELNNGELNMLSNRGDNVVAFINNSRPEFFGKFGQSIRSGDQQSVEQALDYAVQTLLDLGISNGEGQHVAASFEAGKNCHKWIIRTHFLILRKYAEISTNTGVINAPEVGLEKEILVNSIVKSFQP